MVRVIGAPFDYCGRKEGSAMGPAALRLAGLVRTLRTIVDGVEDAGDVSIPLLDECSEGFHCFPALEGVALALKSAVGESLSAGFTPLVLGGDHSIAVGSVSAAMAAFPDDLAVLWIDAHADVNTPATSPSGNLHGMPLAALTGLDSGVTGARDLQWRNLLDRVVPKPRLAPAKVAWFGLRDIDRDEGQTLLDLKPGFVATMHEVDRFGIVEMASRLDDRLRAAQAKRLWISFDVDCLDPVLAPGTGTAVRGGLTYREAHLLAELMHEMLDSSDCPYSLAGVDVVETNPSLDVNNMTAVTAVEWVASLFGKMILGKR